MKNVIKKLALVLVVGLTLMSCSKDDAPTDNSSTIIDDWAIEKYGYMDDANAVVIEYDWSSDCSTKRDYLILNAPNTFTVNYFSNACESTFFSQENGAYTLNATNDRLTISGGTDWDGYYAVLTLTNTELVIKRIPTSGVVNKLGMNFYKLSRRN